MTELTESKFPDVYTTMVTVCRLLRLAAYRQFTHWTHEKLGRGVRVVIPLCVVSAVRRAFPEESGHYVAFKDANDSQ